jgi:transcriptional regulator with XRE-family HTH domain
MVEAAVAADLRAIRGDAMDQKQIGQKVRARRVLLGLTGTALARKVRLTQAQVSRLENGLQGFRAATLARIAKVLGVPPIYFFVENEQPATVEMAQDLKKHGLEPSRGLRKALANPAFLRFLEKCAKAFNKDKKKLDRIAAAVKRVV